jgi:hypothetical protein
VARRRRERSCLLVATLALACARPAAAAPGPWTLRDEPRAREPSSRAPATRDDRLTRRYSIRVTVDPELLARALGRSRRALQEHSLQLVLLGRARWLTELEDPPPSILSVVWASDAARGRRYVVIEADARAIVTAAAPWDLRACEQTCAREIHFTAEWMHADHGELELEWFLLADLEGPNGSIQRVLGVPEISVIYEVPDRPARATSKMETPE